MKEFTTCGCTCHEIDIHDPNNILFEKKYWNCLCALKESIRLLGKTKEELANLQKEVEHLRNINKQYEALKHNVEQLICPECFTRVREQWVFTDGGFCCTDCAGKLFPQYGIS